jgi:predicted Zn-dependent protease
MKELSTEDQRHIQAAEGWSELGDPIEARAELAQISPEQHGHPAALEVQWQLAAREKQWEAGLEIASTLVQTAPDLPLGWVHRSYCLHELKRTAEARDNLLRVVDKYPKDAIMRYNLACYECQLGRLREARQWLAKAFALANQRKIREMALDDLDLKPLWGEIREMTGPA